MLESTLNQYVSAVNIAVNQLMQIETQAELEGKLDYTQRVLNATTGSVALGIESQQQAVRAAIKQLAEKGITGFVDRGGHHWTPEAYVNMDVRTTVHNTSIQAQRARSADYGVVTFQISTHPGARPLCAPYQGWICSWDNGAGTVEDLYGKAYQVHPINETSYGEAAGIFGINCGHYPNTFIPGYSVARFEELTPEQLEENAKRYEEFQKQRALERNIRAAKTEALCYDAAGDKVAFDKASLTVKRTTAAYKEYCESADLTPRLYRLQVGGYNRSIASKVTASVYNQPDRIFAIREKRTKSGRYTITQQQIERVRREYLPDIAFPVEPVYNAKISSNGQTIVAVYPWGEVKGIKKIEIGCQDRESDAFLADTLLHEYLEAQIALRSTDDPFFKQLHEATEKERHKYIDEQIALYAKEHGWKI